MYRGAIEFLMNAGRGRDALAFEILDIRNVAGTKYNGALLEMLSYAKQLTIFGK